LLSGLLSDRRQILLRASLERPLALSLATPVRSKNDNGRPECRASPPTSLEARVIDESDQ
ncbi:MAG: hypothetical protein ACO3NC_11740, partial [Pseudohongiellaceae bacterium]